MGFGNRLSIAWDALTGRVRRLAPAGKEGSQWIVPEQADPRSEAVLADAYSPPYRGPLDLDDYGQETSEMRKAYRNFHRKEPAAKAAIEGKVAAIAALDIVVLPEDESSEIDKKGAEFVRYAVAMAPGGWSGLVTKILEPALIDGFSVVEKVIGSVTESKKWAGYWGLAKSASKDTAHMALQMDLHRNVTGIVNHVRGLQAYTLDKFILFTHAEMFQNPFGRSDMRAAYRSCNLIDSAYKLWYIVLNNFSGPFLSAKSKTTGALRTAFESALRTARTGGYIVTPPDDDIEVLNLASATSFEAFERKINKCREEIFLSIRGAYLPFTEGSGMGSDAHGNTAVNKVASDSLEYLLAVAVADCIRRQLFPDLIRPNFGAQCGIPKLTFGGTNWDETKTQLDVAKQVQDLGGDVSKAWIYEVSKVEPPRDDGDKLAKPQQQPMGGGFGLPGMGSMPGGDGSGSSPADQPPTDGQKLPFSEGAGGGNLSAVDVALAKAIGNRVRSSLARRVA